MIIRSYHPKSGIKATTAQVMDLFNNIVISRFDRKYNLIKNFQVPCVYGTRSRVIKSLENRNNTLKLPLIALSMVGMGRDAGRTIIPHQGIVEQSGGSGSYQYSKNTAIPMNVQYRVDVIAKTQEDVDQILNNFMVFFNPSVWVVVPHPYDDTRKNKIQVTWQNNVSIDYAENISANKAYQVSANTSFLVKTWMYPGMFSNSELDGPVIDRINFNPNIIYDDNNIGRLQHHHAIPNEMDYDEYMGYLKEELIDPHCYDELQIDGRITGYWQDIEPLIYLQLDPPVEPTIDPETGEPENLSIGNPTYLTADTNDNGITDIEDDILVYTDAGYLTEGMQSIGPIGLLDYLLSLEEGGDLEGYEPED